jgi:putative tricarboxylic transport membrane protein
MIEFDQLLNGFITFFSLKYLLACLVGAFFGTVIGVLPGVGPVTTMTLMLPFTFLYDPAVGLIMLSGVLCGAMYGGSTTSILVNIPGEAASVITCIDGYEMAKKGRGGSALVLVAVGSFISGSIAIAGMQIFAPKLAQAALAFGPPEYFSLMVMAFVLLSSLSGDSMLKGSLMFGLGLWLSSVGICPLDSVPRFTLGSNDLMLGVEFLPVAVGLFGISEVFRVGMTAYMQPIVKKVHFRELYPNREEIRRSIWPIFRGSLLGFFIGLLPGPAAVIASFTSYALEKRISRNPHAFGHGAVEGVVGPESSNNSAAVSSLIPLLTLGIPFNAPSAILLACLLMHNVEPGPLLFQNSPQIFWTFVASLYIGNIVLLILNLPLVGVFARLAMTKPPVLMPFISMICLLGVYNVRNSFFDVWVMVLAGMAGVFFRRWNYPVAPLIIGLILGPMTENSMRKTLMIFKGNLSEIFDKPLALFFLSLALAIIAFKISSYLWHRGSHKAPAIRL